MKKKISDLKIGDTVEIKGKYFDVYKEPVQLMNGPYVFALVNHGEIDKIHKMPYITPTGLSYELSSNFDNEEVTVWGGELMMEIIKYGDSITREVKTCYRCKSIFSYTKYDVETCYGDWKRIGIERSKRNVAKCITCPICGNKITLKSWTEEF